MKTVEFHYTITEEKKGRGTHLTFHAILHYNN